MRRNDIQGLRAVAVLGVVFFHAWPKVFQGGYVGVDVFFVISGYVMTLSFLTKGADFSLFDFYAKRIVRLAPAFYTVALFSFFVALFLLGPTELIDFSSSFLASIFYIANFYFNITSDYFSVAAEYKPFLHFWSLSVEEQFYLFFPLVILIFRNSSRRVVEFLILLSGCISILLCFVFYSLRSGSVFFLLPFRIWEFIFGVAVAYFYVRRNFCLPTGFGVLGFIVVVISYFILPASSDFYWLLMPVVGAFFVIASRPDGSLILCNSFMGGIGNWSYSIYLWHWPLMAFVRQVYGSELSFFVGFSIISFVIFISFFTYRFVELKAAIFLGDMRSAYYFLLSFVVLSSVACCWVMQKQGLTVRFDSQTLKYFSYEKDSNPRRNTCHDSMARVDGYDRLCQFGALNVEPSVAVWADSHGAEFSAEIAKELQERGTAALQITASACPPSLNYGLPERPTCKAHNHYILEQLLADKRISDVYLLSNFERYKNYKFEEMLSGFESLIFKLEAAGKRVKIISQVPTFSLNPPAYIAINNLYRWNEDIVRTAVRANSEISVKVDSWLAAHVSDKGWNVYFPSEYFCVSDDCLIYRPDYGVLYFNSDHLGLVGYRYFIDSSNILNN